MLFSPANSKKKIARWPDSFAYLVEVFNRPTLNPYKVQKKNLAIFIPLNNFYKTGPLITIVALDDANALPYYSIAGKCLVSIKL